MAGMHPDSLPLTVPLTAEEVARFQAEVYAHYRDHGRRLPWRETRDPYAILVSEFMLQQTQVARVMGKYPPFLAAFPDFVHLAQAPLPEVLAAWQGLGYNRRALALRECAAQVLSRFGGRLPDSPRVLATLPGVGPATAGAVCAFAFEKPVVFIETNIRRVFLHRFFPEAEAVPDRELLPLVALTLDPTRVRHWYYALMDYGVKLAKQGSNPNRRSAHYARQASFRGSDRELRGAILRELLNRPGLTLAALAARVGRDVAHTARLAVRLAEEGFLACQHGRWRIAWVRDRKEAT
jgi:A/G-specific adenine glycosylase